MTPTEAKQLAAERTRLRQAAHTAEQEGYEWQSEAHFQDAWRIDRRLARAGYDADGEPIKIKL